MDNKNLNKRIFLEELVNFQIIDYTINVPKNKDQRHSPEELKRGRKGKIMTDFKTKNKTLPCKTLECKLCNKIYKRPSGLKKHKKIIKDLNTIKPSIYILPEKAIEETRQMLVYHIKEKLKQNSRHIGNVSVTISGTESQFFGVFKGYIHNYFPKSGTYKCIFKGADAYSTLTHILKDENWGVKYFLQHQKTFNKTLPCKTLECKLCNKIYKRPSGLKKHKKIIKDLNTIKPSIYILPEKAIEETRQMLVYHIKEKLKQNSRHIGNVSVTISGTESQFFGVFKGYIHNYFPKSGTYKCIFKGADAYSTLTHILKDENWGVKYFLQHQKTFVLLNSNNQDSLQESYLNKENQEPDPLQELDPLQKLDPLQELDPFQEHDPLQEPDQLNIQKSRNISRTKVYNSVYVDIE
ncbi:hypothetical protein Glove_4g25 [Diversispora epigaea]|uniref:C2H2-type domain-containing protein n=1 Tax=Diversispora epigaea TaxID=1348612 RepID=A0A397JS24_9GLOM|nr:hypothetical protein Glove_4g25 [Diversispora epigaea]